MTTLPYIGSGPVGIHQVCTAANTDYPIAIPDNATGCVLWFETSASNAAPIRGRIGLNDDDTAVTGITGTDTELGYHPPMPVQYEIPEQTYNYASRSAVRKATHLHVACATAGAVVRGYWLSKG